ncbi:MAG TPA: bifunctional isocitrate dehydrogenase kinase/phosphatase [Gemmatimonadaceae bacterium]|nr:bifunctional isocitrate dehydrogenase kinase/phosphatase [Gemmatimonadaceae bacterium]
MIKGNARAMHAATIVSDAFRRYRESFVEITRRAQRRFEARDWHGGHADAAERLALYRDRVDATLPLVRDALQDCATDLATWQSVKWLYAALIAERDDCEIGESFYNSIARRIFSTVGVNAQVEYVFPDADPGKWPGEESDFRRYEPHDGLPAMIRQLLEGLALRAPWRDLEGDSIAAAERIGAALEELGVDPAAVVLEVIDAPFYRNKGAYIVGRIRLDEQMLPVVLALMHGDRGVYVDAVLLTSDEVSIVFGFSWSYFQADISCPCDVVDFLGSIMPLKRVDELYNSLGFNKHGKTQLYRSLVEHLHAPGARFELTPGDEGLVMSVFTLPSLNVVFKVIKDSFGYPKRTTRRDVMERYRLVFLRDRVGRLADAQEFEHLEFPRECFPDALLRHLVRVAGSTVRVAGDAVVIRHLYTERRVTPLNLYLREASSEQARDAILDYGQAIKDLAAANIFTGDMLPKNFGVSRHGRVIFYDYDELVLLTDCVFRRIPRATNPDDEMSAEPWYYVGERDVFPEEFAPFMVPSAPLGDIFLSAHSDLLTVDFWIRAQAQQRAGELRDVFPYRGERRLGGEGKGSGNRVQGSGTTGTRRQETGSR